VWQLRRWFCRWWWLRRQVSVARLLEATAPTDIEASEKEGVRQRAGLKGWCWMKGEERMEVEARPTHKIILTWGYFIGHYTLIYFVDKIVFSLSYQKYCQKKPSIICK
jgi:hypothetical protein